MNYYYAGDYVYRNDTLEFISHPEGRLRPVRIDTTQAILVSNLKYIYDYFLRDFGVDSNGFPLDKKKFLFHG